MNKKVHFRQKNALCHNSITEKGKLLELLKPSTKFAESESLILGFLCLPSKEDIDE